MGSELEGVPQQAGAMAQPALPLRLYDCGGSVALEP